MAFCFYCAEPFDANHRNVCQKKPQNQSQVNALALNDLDVVLTDEVLNQLATEDALTEDFCQLSLNALVGTDSGDAMKVRALVKNKVMLILIDSGSSHSFVSQNFLNTVGIQSKPAPPKQVKLANGEFLVTDQWVPQLEWWTNGYTLHTDMKVLDMAAYDAILGFDWLKRNNPMWCDWSSQILKYQHKGQEVVIQGVPAPLKTVQEVDLAKVVKWTAGNDVWAIALVDKIPPVTDHSELPEVQKLLQDYQDVFQQPTTLPPQRFYDHQIPLLPG